MEVELNKNWLNNIGFFPMNKDKLKDKTILVYCEDLNINGDDTINFFIKLCESYISNIKFKLCNDIDLIEKFNDIDYYFFVEPKNRNNKHCNFISNFLDYEKLYLLLIQKYNVKDDVLIEKIDIRNNNCCWILEFYNRMSRNRCLKEDCVEAFINDNKDLLENKKVLVYNQHKYCDRLRTLLYFMSLIRDKINFDFDVCFTFEEFKNKLNDYDIVFIKEEPYYPSNEIDKNIEDIKNDNNKDLFLFNVEYDYIDNAGLCEIIKSRHNINKYFIRFINRIEDY